MIFLNSVNSAAALVFYLLGVCTHTGTEGKQRKARVQNILKSLEKTQYLMNTLYIRAAVVVFTVLLLVFTVFAVFAVQRLHGSFNSKLTKISEERIKIASEGLSFLKL